MMVRKDVALSRGEDLPPIVPTGQLIHLDVSQIKPNPNNPRRLFDPEPLRELKESIRTHGVLVPITVYKLPGQDKYGIVDGERRFKSCAELQQEGVHIQIPANVVTAPNKMASLVYMFNIHSFREQWELMPTALSLQQVIDGLDVTDDAQLHQITGLSDMQIDRCKKILTFPEEWRSLSLDPNPKERIPSNFWIELYPVLEIAPEVIPDLYARLGRDGITRRMVDKYRAGSIRSVIHFRRIMEALQFSEGEIGKQDVADALREFILDTGLETRQTFDRFVQDVKIYRKAVDACDSFIRDLKRSKLDFAVEGREDLIQKLREVIDYVEGLLDRLEGQDAPEAEASQEDME